MGVRTLTTSTVQTFDMKRVMSKNRLRGLLHIMSGYEWHYAGAITSLAISTLGRTGALLLIGYFVDDVLGRDDVAQVVPFIGLGFLFLAMIQGGFSYLSGRLAAQTAENIAWRIRNYLFDHLQRLSFSYHDRMQTGELLQRSTSDVDAIRRFYIEQGVGIGRIVILFTINFVAILSINVQLALVSVIIIPPLIAVSLFFFSRIMKRYEAMQKQEATLSTTLQEHLSGVRVVRAFARQEFEREKFERENVERFRMGRNLLYLDSMFWPSTDLMTGFQMIAGIGVAGWMVIHDSITVGNFIAYIGMIGMIIMPMRMLGRLIVKASTGLVSYQRVMEIVAEERERLDEDTAAPVENIKGAIEFKNVWFEYDENVPVLEDISFRCEPGQTIALLGSTGAGKTSMLGLLPRFYDYTSGSITLDEIELREYPRAFLRANIGVVEQEPFLFSRSIRENITYGVDYEVSDEEVIQAAQAAAIHESIESFPQQYDTLVGERGVTLSGGQKQRIALARTLLKNPRILILDDATSSVDTETEAAIRDALNNLMTDRTTFVIAHRIQTVMHADLILVMDKGRIVQMGTHRELIHLDGIYKRTYEMQARIELELEKDMASV